MAFNLSQIVNGVRQALYGREVREWIAQMGEWVYNWMNEQMAVVKNYRDDAKSILDQGIAKIQAAMATLSPATNLNNGLMSKEDKIKLDGLKQNADLLVMHHYAGFIGAYDVTLSAKNWVKKTDTDTGTIYYQNKAVLSEARAAFSAIGFLTGYNALNQAGQVAEVPDYRADIYDENRTEDGSVCFYATKAYQNDLYATVLLFGMSEAKESGGTATNGLSEVERNLLMTLAENTAYVRPDMKSAYKALKDLWQK